MLLLLMLWVRWTYSLSCLEKGFESDWFFMKLECDDESSKAQKENQGLMSPYLYLWPRILDSS